MFRRACLVEDAVIHLDNFAVISVHQHRVWSFAHPGIAIGRVRQIVEPIVVDPEVARVPAERQVIPVTPVMIIVAAGPVPLAMPLVRTVGVDFMRISLLVVARVAAMTARRQGRLAAAVLVMLAAPGILGALAGARGHASAAMRRGFAAA